MTFRIHLPDCKDREHLFRQLTSETWNSLNQAKINNNLLDKSAKLIIYNNNLHWWDLQEKVKDFLYEVKCLGWRIVAVIDEFDEARNLFQSNENTFNCLRDLASQPDYKISLVTLSRRNLSDILKQAKANPSIFEGIFHQENIEFFSYYELGQLLEKTEKIDLFLNEKDLNFVWKNTGGHPLLSWILAFYISEIWLVEKKCDLNKSLDKASEKFEDYYKKIIDRLKQENSLESLYIFKNKDITNPIKIDYGKLNKTGLVKRNNNNIYKPFSTHFEQYLQSIEYLVIEENQRKNNQHQRGNMTKENPEIYYNDFRGATIANLASKMQDNARQQAIQHNYPSEKKQTLAEAAEEIQKLLKKLEESNPDATIDQQQMFVDIAVNPTLKTKFVGALQAGWKEAIKEMLDNSYVNVGIAILEGWQNAQ